MADTSAFNSPAKTKGRPDPIVFNRSGSVYGSEDPGAKPTAEDPRSPGVPRSPGGLGKKATISKTPSKASGRPNNISVNTGTGGGVGGNDPQSPLAAFITQTDASGTPTHRNTFAATQEESTPGKASGGGGVASPGADGEAGGSGALCCCWQPSAKGKGGEEGAQGGGGGGGGGTQMVGGDVGGAASPAPKKASKKTPTFGTFHYEDPAHPSDKPILPPVAPQDKGKMCLVLDLDETLVHSSFRAVPNPDYIIPVQIEDVVHHVYVCKRPGVDEYLRRCGERYEVIIYTASLNKYADPLLDKLDTGKVIRHRLFRESCTQYQGNYVKNLSLLGRDLRTCIIVDNSPLSYLFHPENAVGCISWIDQQDDEELEVIQDFCEVIEKEEDIRYHMRHWRQGKNYDVASAYRE